MTMRLTRGAILFAFPLLVIAVAFYLPPAMRREASGATSEQANRNLRFLDLPQAASNVTYRHDMYAGLTEAAEFTIEEQGFLDWAAENQWQPIPFDVGEPLGRFSAGWFTSVFHEGEPPPIIRGYRWDDYERDTTDDNGTAVLYDLESKRCYVTYATY